jgi:HD superfamily phosphohydrolase
MYWQVYLHKTVLSAERMLVKIIERAIELVETGKQVSTGSKTLDYFLQSARETDFIEKHLGDFCRLDDVDVMHAIKNWSFHEDIVLSSLSKMIIERRLLKIKWQADPIAPGSFEMARQEACRKLGVSGEESRYFVFTGEAVNTTYDPTDEMINILFKDGTVKDISKVDNALIHQELASPVKKFYICYLK